MEAESFDEGNISASGKMKKNLLNRDVGITEINIARSCWVSGVLLPYKILVEKIKSTKSPQQHLTARRIREFYMQLQVGWVVTTDEDPLYPNTPFQQWITRMLQQGNTTLVDLVKNECHAFAAVLLQSVKERLKPTWDHIQALELVDPLGPDLGRFAKPDVWSALENICSRRSLDFEKCRAQIIVERSRCGSRDAVSRGRIIHDLLGYCRQNRDDLLRAHTETDTPELDLLRVVVFSIVLVSAFVESLFSKMEYNQSKVRSRLGDDMTSVILHAHDAALADPQQPLSSKLTLKTTVTSVKEKEKMLKHIGKIVCKLFDGCRFHGRVVGVECHEIYARWMYTIKYTDGDMEDYWRNELEIYACRCPDIEDGDVVVDM